MRLTGRCRARFRCRTFARGKTFQQCPVFFGGFGVAHLMIDVGQKRVELLQRGIELEGSFRRRDRSRVITTVLQGEGQASMVRTEPRVQLQKLFQVIFGRNGLKLIMKHRGETLHRRFMSRIQLQ